LFSQARDTAAISMQHDPNSRWGTSDLLALLKIGRDIPRTKQGPIFAMIEASQTFTGAHRGRHQLALGPANDQACAAERSK
jgi:hypothetical protein